MQIVVLVTGVQHHTAVLFVRLGQFADAQPTTHTPTRLSAIAGRDAKAGGGYDLPTAGGAAGASRLSALSRRCVPTLIL